MSGIDSRLMPAGTAVWPNRLLAAGRNADLSAHLAAYGALDVPAARRVLIDELQRSGLTGRGGAAFPTAAKLSAVAAQSRTRGRVVIANGAEGEPRSVKDARLLADAPHLVLDGLLAVAAAVGAERTVVHASGRSLAAVRAAVRERREARRVELVESADAFVSGEAGAVVSAVGGGRPIPVDRIARLTESGLRGRPTLVQNVETLAHVGLIARYGSRWFREVGTTDDPGSRLVTISGDVLREGVLEVRGGAPLAEILDAAGWRGRPGAVLVGGYHGAWVTSAHLGHPLSRSGLERFGAQPGAGVLYAISDRVCGLHATAEIVGYLAAESAGQCGPCRFGLPDVARLFGDLARGVRDPSLPHRIASAADAVVGRGACHHPDGTARLIRSALAAFADDVNAHPTGYCTRAV
ncbi:NADH-ubiquinone oxidoreductase-F iron-sulfur binding region domain-containing protein [Pseudolysinimonas sp.]|uniref:NADH-ubiquinone oxidoreductase-F iron-sulfur binding region domain-containing protein n=1 Tax=Pseudolysinimonas sp. TaxID=2680009 RepID=UPI003F7D2E75